MLDLDPIVDVASCDMSCNIRFHMLPPEKLLQVSIHLGTPWVDAILGVVSLQLASLLVGLYLRVHRINPCTNTLLVHLL